MDARREETLDPADWDSMRRLGHRMVDDMMEHLRTVRERPAWRPMPEAVREAFRQPLPDEPQEPEQVYREFQESVLPYTLGNVHPRFWGWIHGNGSPLAMLAEMLAAGTNSNLFGADHSAILVETQVLAWCKKMFGFPEDASGLLVSGGSMANLVALTVARNVKAGGDVRTEGLVACGRRLTVYASQEVHSSVQKAVELLGLGGRALRKVPVDSNQRIDLAALEPLIVEDRARGLQPFCVVGNAGTVNTGAFDDLEALADLCSREGLWFHVDGAFGALAALSPRLERLVAGLSRADSMAFCLHKWMHVPIEASCVLTRHAEAHHESFATAGKYLSHAARGVAAGKNWFSEFGVQLSRGFRALKAWMSIKEHGIRKFGRLIEQNVDQARLLAELVEAHPRLELLAPVPLNIVCFRFDPGGTGEDALDAINREVLVRLQEEGVAVPSGTLVDGRFAIRVAITNHRTRREDLTLLVESVVRLGSELTEAARPEARRSLPAPVERSHQLT